MSAWHVVLCAWACLLAAVIIMGAFKFDTGAARTGAVLIGGTLLLCVLGMVLR